MSQSIWRRKRRRKKERNSCQERIYCAMVPNQDLLKMKRRDTYTSTYKYTNKRSNSTGGEFTRQRESRGLVCPWKFSSTCLTLFTRHWTELSLTVGMVHDSQQEQRANDREDLKLNLPPRMEGSLTKYEMDMEGRNRD